MAELISGDILPVPRVRVRVFELDDDHEVTFMTEGLLLGRDETRHKVLVRDDDGHVYAVRSQDVFVEPSYWPYHNGGNE